MLEGISVADMQDCMGDPGLRHSTLMTPRMKALLPDRRVLGQAVTAYCPPGDNLMMHTALYFAERGDVLVVSNGGVEVGALWGDNATAQAQAKGLAAVVIDGPIRDTVTVRAQNFAVWSTSTSVSPPTKNKLGSVNSPIVCDGVIVNPGDIIIADGDGVVALPRQLAADLAKRALEQTGKEKKMKATIASGGTIFESLKLGEAIAQLDGKIVDAHWTPNS
jgi:4-hydroxy-4-methyl-2-oxoglutarate aldolase